MIEMKMGLGERLPIGGREETERQKCCLDVPILISTSLCHSVSPLVLIRQYLSPEGT